ncbi:two component transcriptional regulator, LuxR family [Janthinobacterium sp. TND4EL3]|uniref:response regulator n=1 Tax=Janthinobacterium sp. TND4EL3 TaxID=1907311 RepID=UPI00095446B9|nr:response regulator transcription factor [Janthinobacterium sp. TND4EL3]SIQ07223.1 two component transcriptional regulator, LuxR family [Janthinobacterium sp. TND4EL3]
MNAALGPIRVMLVDDHPVVRSGYRRLLEQGGDIAVVAEAGNGETAYVLHQEHAPDVCVTDLSMPGIGGLELLRKLLARDAHARVLVFTMHDTPQLIARALDGGACGFVSKQADPEHLVDAVRAAHAGRRYLDPHSAPAVLHDAAGTEAQRLSSLSQREFEIFRLLAAGHSAADCARLLHVSSKTVANHQTCIKEKLDVPGPAALVHLALRNGVIESIHP